MNAQKHGVLASEALVVEGEGAEDREAYEALLVGFRSDLAIQGDLQEVLVEKLAVNIWRLKRLLLV